MTKSKWAIALVLTMGLLSINETHADVASKHCNQRIADLEMQVAELNDFIKQMQSPDMQIKKCNDRSIDLRSVNIGFKCQTSTGAIFERVSKSGFSEAWKGPDGLIWSDFQGNYTLDDAWVACTNLGGALPSRADFERGNANGFLEVLPNLKAIGRQNRQDSFWNSNYSEYWTSTFDNNPANFFVFNTLLEDGHHSITRTFSQSRKLVYSARCVGR